MSYIRTFFGKPLKQVPDTAARIVAIDFSTVAVIFDNREVRFHGGGFIVLSKDSWLDFIPVFEQYCKDIQSQERGAVNLLSRVPVKMPENIGEQKVIADPKADAENVTKPFNPSTLHA